MDFDFDYLGFEYKGDPYLFDARVELLQTAGGDYDSKWVEYSNWRTDRQDGEIDVTMPDGADVTITTDGSVKGQRGTEITSVTATGTDEFLFSEDMQLLDEPAPDPARSDF